MKKIILGIVAIAVIFGGVHFASAGCGGWFEPSCGDNQKAIEDNQNRLETAVPLPHLESSLERANIKKRLETWSDENKVSYIYLTSYGKVMAFYVVKGKVTSGSKRLTSQEKFISCEQGNAVGDCSVEAPELDGTYGHSADYIYFWTTDGAYVQWNGEYMLSDQPLKLSTQPELVRQVK